MPIVEPEVLMDGGHDIDRCAEITQWVLKDVPGALLRACARRHGVKPNMIVPGKKSGKPRGRGSRREDHPRAQRLRSARVPGIAFLSGGQSDEDATAHLVAINAMGRLPWPVTFSYGRALQAAAKNAWSGSPENVAAANAPSSTAPMNGLAAIGKWKADLERKARADSHRPLLQNHPPS